MKNYSSLTLMAIPFVAIAWAFLILVIGGISIWKLWSILSNISVITFFIIGIIVLFIFLLIMRKRR